MAQTSFPFDGLDTTEDNYSYFFREIIGTGVVGTGGDLLVSADGSGLNVKIAPGMAVVRGFAYRNTANETLPIDAGGGTARTDLVVLRLDPSANTIRLAVLTGPAGGAAPVPTQTDVALYELPIALVTVPANAVTIQAANVADRRVRGGARLGFWSRSALRPAAPRRRELGWNDELSKWETWDGSSWVDLLSWANISGRPTSSMNDGRNVTVTTGEPSGGKHGDLHFKALV